MLGLKVTLFFLVIGFIAGVAVHFFGGPIMQFLIETLPQLLYMQWFISGVIGAILTLLLVLIWNWIMRRRQ